ncbi:MAG TPA: hypothetical protein VF533_24440 [Solirubrobacteraceae bacterium]|jgi:hypothetical protein
MQFQTPLPGSWAPLLSDLDPDDLYEIQFMLGALSVVQGVCGPMCPEDIRAAAPALSAELRDVERRLSGT